MGIEAYILPWLILMSIVVAYGTYSLIHRTLPAFRDSEVGRQRRMQPSFWLRQAVKIAVVIFALTQVTGILKRIV